MELNFGYYNSKLWNVHEYMHLLTVCMWRGLVCLVFLIWGDGSPTRRRGRNTCADAQTASVIQLCNLYRCIERSALYRSLKPPKKKNKLVNTCYVPPLNKLKFIIILMKILFKCSNYNATRVLNMPLKLLECAHNLFLLSN